jgi:hypothetical protein
MPSSEVVASADIRAQSEVGKLSRWIQGSSNGETKIRICSGIVVALILGEKRASAQDQTNNSDHRPCRQLHS